MKGSLILMIALAAAAALAAGLAGGASDGGDALGWEVEITADLELVREG